MKIVIEATVDIAIEGLSYTEVLAAIVEQYDRLSVREKETATFTGYGGGDYDEGAGLQMKCVRLETEEEERERIRLEQNRAAYEKRSKVLEEEQAIKTARREFIWAREELTKRGIQLPESGDGHGTDPVVHSTRDSGSQINIC